MLVTGSCDPMQRLVIIPYSDVSFNFAISNALAKLKLAHTFGSIYCISRNIDSDFNFGDRVKIAKLTYAIIDPFILQAWVSLHTVLI